MIQSYTLANYKLIRRSNHNLFTLNVQGLKSGHGHLLNMKDVRFYYLKNISDFLFF